MDKTPLGKFAENLLRRRSGASHDAERAGEPIAFGLEGPLVLGFVEGGLDTADEARLAEEVAKTLPLRWSLPSRALERLNLLSNHLGGERGLLKWLDGHPGLPRLTARLLVLVDGLERYTDDPAVVTAVRDFRAGHGLPEELGGVLPPATSAETLSDLSSRLDRQLFDHDVEGARSLGLATSRWLRDAASAATSPSPGLTEMGEVMARLHEDLAAAST
ncbi:hypothetical protein [Streptomyces sp. BRB081]|uniref:hypothetical protein n=1 Tax=Streptomyces sp. BRB081 TaxID=2769544 RepID=UPI0027DCC859|nr:hypothetical protein [Streptomyces sp. BRB081]